MDTQLEKIKRRLGITDTQQDSLIKDLIEDAQSMFMVLTGAEEVDGKYNFMIRDAALKLYARKGSEGIERETVEGYTVHYASNLFEDYLSILERDFDLNSQKKAGRVMFY